MNIVEAQKEVNKLLEAANLADKGILKAMKIANEFGLSFRYRPLGMGTFRGNLNRNKCLALIESGEFELLDYNTQEHIQEFLEASNDENWFSDDDYDSWQTSFC